MNNYSETITDIMLRKNGVSRKHYITVSDAFCAAQLAYEKELLLIVPKKYACSLLAFFPLKLFQLPFISQKFYFELLYRNIDYSQTHQWLKKQILDFLQDTSL
ncbi:hypothetical protein [Francisella sp. 19X1-34]|uniref:hypothetical protein n=1 Tax=Francisella sp. 19X1-34 TaxID=3087177 RepID=UPI002E349D33|nr:hypothetical protein [Francisella sp. 19X1-34]MED7788422.1 hypothetical protein [Francisella sp. 19X1-34]